MDQEVKEHTLSKWVSRAGHASMSCPCLLASANGPGAGNGGML